MLKNPSFFQVAWQWLPVKSSARSDDLQLFHWVCSLALEPYYTKVEHLILSNVMCIVRLEWLMMFHHQVTIPYNKLNVIYPVDECLLQSRFELILLSPLRL